MASTEIPPDESLLSDPQRSMVLLWRSAAPAQRRGPKPRFTVEAIVQAAVALADAEGLAALSMRRVAERLGVGVMSLYTYVPSKAELLDLMIDTVHAELARVDSEADAPPACWRDRLARSAREHWMLYQRHPWLLQVNKARPVLGPNIFAQYDEQLQAVDGLGLSDLEMDAVVVLLADYVHGAARGAVDAAQSEQRTGQSIEAWWSSYGPLLEQLFDPDRYPLAARVGQVAGETHQAAYHAAFAFTFGLQRVLDGIEALVRSRRRAELS
ncbi:MAG: TetR/AcrR family transcriptional regulator C-terminal domain-containing protein [Chloroflexi bacterium]|nr:TetR/AcrR family transcriptional regulator C-terminal domain-containing protein [Chloroflexota bacterium]